MQYNKLNIFLPIIPKYQYLILNKEKDIELRRKVPFIKKYDKGIIDKVIVYQSRPVNKIVGEFSIKYIIHEDLDILFNEYKNRHKVVNQNEFFNYFSGLRKGFGIVVKDVKKYNNEIDVKKVLGEDFSIPQFFRYINNEQYENIRKEN